MVTQKLLLTGASGYIGGAVLSALLKSKNPVIEGLEISVLVRSEEQAALLRSNGVSPIIFKGFDDLGTIQHAASQHDAVIHAALSIHTPSARALIQGLAERKAHTGNDVFYIHTSGMSNLSDKPITGEYLESRVFSDEDPDIYEYLKHRNAIEQYDQRTTDIAVVDTGRETGIKTYILMPPVVYGLGSGPFNKSSIPIPTIIQAALKSRQVEVIGDGSAVMDYVHIADLASLYVLVLTRVLEGTDMPSGERGIYFCATGSYTWKQLSTRIGKAGYELGVLDTPEVKSISLDEAAERWTKGSRQVAQLGFSANARSKAALARKLGWKPQKTEQDWADSFALEFEYAIKQGSKYLTLLDKVTVPR